MSRKHSASFSGTLLFNCCDISGNVATNFFFLSYALSYVVTIFEMSRIFSFLLGSFFYRDSEENVASFSTLYLSQFRLLLLLFLLLVMLILAKQ